MLTTNLGAPRSAGDELLSTSDKRESTGNKPGITGDQPASTGAKSGSASNHSRAVWEKYLVWQRCWCAWKSELLLIVQQFLKLMYSVCILIYVSISLPINTWYIGTACRRCLRANRGAPEHEDRVNTEIHSETVIVRVWRCPWRW